MGKKLTSLEADVLAPNFTGATYFNVKWTGVEGNSTAIATSMSDDGSVRKTVSYKNGKKHGKEITQESFDGSTVTAVYNHGQLEQVTYEQVATHPYTVYYKDGKPHHSDKYDSVTFAAIQDLGVLGNPNVETVWSGKVGESVLSVYNEDGELLRTTEHKNGKKHGKEVTYDFSFGKLQRLPQEDEMQFDDIYGFEMSKENVSVQYYQNGELKLEDEFVDDDLQKTADLSSMSLKKTLGMASEKFVDEQNMSIDLMAWLGTNYNNNSMG